VEEAARLLAELGDGAKVIAGGQSLVPLMNFRLAEPDHLVDVNALAGVDHVRVGEDAVEVGATLRTGGLLRDPAVAEAHPLLAAAAGWIAHPVIRNRGTVCGSLVHADPAAELPAVLALLDGAVEAVAWRSGSLARRSVTATELFVGPFETSLDHDELVVAARFPRLAPATGWAMDELARRHGDYALAGVALTVTTDGRGAPSGGRAAYLSCAPTPVVLDLGPALVSAADGGASGSSAAGGVDGGRRGGAPGGDGAPGGGAPAGRAMERAVYDLVSGALSPTGDIHASADYRRHLAATLTVRSLGPALARSRAAADARGATGEVTH
jgi:carbon-monoxide dehydrogenase medium subunit